MRRVDAAECQLCTPDSRSSTHISGFGGTFGGSGEYGGGATEGPLSFPIPVAMLMGDTRCKRKVG